MKQLGNPIIVSTEHLTMSPIQVKNFPKYVKNPIILFMGSIMGFNMGLNAFFIAFAIGSSAKPSTNLFA